MGDDRRANDVEGIAQVVPLGDGMPGPVSRTPSSNRWQPAAAPAPCAALNST